MFIFLVVWSIAALGLAYIIGHSIATMWIRELIWGPDPDASTPRTWIVTLMECPACLGFWIGLATGWLIRDHVDLPTWGTLIVASLYTSGSNFILGRLTGLMKEV